MIKVIFVCMGNICRSPAAEGVFRNILKINGLEKRVEADSAGTHGYHVGESPDSRTQRAALERGYDLSQIRARRVAPQDLAYFDMVLAMDRSNLDNLRRMAPDEHKGRIHLLMDFSENFDDDEVPDPFYGLGFDFDLVIDMVEDASQGLIKTIKKKLR